MNEFIEKMLTECEKLCDNLRELRRKNPDKFFDTPEEGLLKNLDKTLNSFYQLQATEPREITKLKIENQRLAQEVGELEYELVQLRQEMDKKI